MKLEPENVGFALIIHLSRGSVQVAEKQSSVVVTDIPIQRKELFWSMKCLTVVKAVTTEASTITSPCPLGPSLACSAVGQY